MIVVAAIFSEVVYKGTYLRYNKWRVQCVHIVKCGFCTEACNGQTFNNVFIFICFYLKKFLIVCCINLITLNQNKVINTKPKQYSFHSSI